MIHSKCYILYRKCRKDLSIKEIVCFGSKVRSIVVCCRELPKLKIQQLEQQQILSPQVKAQLQILRRPSQWCASVCLWQASNQLLQCFGSSLQLTQMLGIAVVNLRFFIKFLDQKQIRIRPELSLYATTDSLSVVIYGISEIKSSLPKTEIGFSWMAKHASLFCCRIYNSSKIQESL